MRHSQLTVLAAASLWLACAIPGAGQPGWADYNNTKYGFHVAYPTAQFRAEPESGSGDGKELLSKTGHAKVAVWGEWADATDEPQPQTAAKSALESCAAGKPVYHLDRPKLQVVSCVRKDGKVLYTKAVRLKNTLTTFEMTYPESEKSTWDTVAAGMSKSFVALGSPLDDQ